MLHVPGPTRTAEAPLGPVVVHTDGVVETNDTVRPDVAVAVSATGDWVMFFAVGAVNLIVCALLTSSTAVADNWPTVAVTVRMPTVVARQLLAVHVADGVIVNVAVEVLSPRDWP
jgi:hypothetical protein